MNRFWNCLRGVAVVAVACCAYAAHAAEMVKPSMTAARIMYKPKIDGQLSDPCWKEAAWQGDFKVLKTGQPAKEQTQFAVLYDADALYIGIRCHESSMPTLVSNVTTRDSNLWNDDCVEIILMPTDRINPDPNCVQYHHFIVNALGVQYDAFKDGGVENSKWDGEWQSAGYKGTDFWSVEIAIPFPILNLTPETGATWLFNICRERQGKPTEFSSWAPAKDGFHFPQEFGLLKGLDVDFGRHLFTINAVRIVQTEGSIKVGVNVTNHGKYIGGMSTAVYLISQKGEPVELTVSVDTRPGKSDDLLLGPFDLAESGNYTLYVTLRDAVGSILRRVRLEKEITVSPMTVELTQPRYRQSIYPTQEVKEIVAEAAVNIKRDAMPSHTLEATLVADADGKAAAPAVTEKVASGLVTLRVPAQGLAPGRYTLVVTLKNDGKEVVAAKLPVRKLAKAPGCEVRVDEQLNLVVDGKPFFPFGFMGAGDSTYVAAKGFNTLHNYNVHHLTPDKAREYLDTIHAAGLKVFFGPYRKLKQGFFGFEGEAKPGISDRELEGVKDYVRALMDHPAVLGWYLCDEPRGAKFREALARVYRELRELDPYHPCIALDNGAQGCVDLQNAGDIVYVDPYPGFATDGGTVKPITYVSSNVEAIYAGLTRKIPVWLAPQSFSYGDFIGDPAIRAPTYLEERCMTYLGIVKNAKAIVYYKIGTPEAAKSDKKGNAGMYSLSSPGLATGLLEGLGQEIKALSPALLLPASGRKVAVSSDKVFFMLKENGKDFYLFTVNSGEEPVEARITVTGLGARKLFVVCEGRELRSADDGVIADRFGKYEAHVYTTDESLSKLRTVREVEAMSKPTDGK